MTGARAEGISDALGIPLRVLAIVISGLSGFPPLSEATDDGTAFRMAGMVKCGCLPRYYLHKVGRVHGGCRAGL